MDFIQFPPFRTDHVGSLLRPEDLLKARQKWKDGKLSNEELRHLENESIKDAVRLQEAFPVIGKLSARVRYC